MGQVWSGSGRGTLLGEVDEQGQVWGGSGSQRDLIGAIDEERCVWRGSKWNSDLAGEFDADGQVWGGARRQGNLVGTVDSFGQVWRGYGRDRVVAGEVAPGSLADGAALLLLFEEPPSMRGHSVKKTVGSALAMTSVVLVEEALSGRRTRKAEEQLVKLGRRLERARALAGGASNTEAAGIANEVAGVLTARIEAGGDDQNLLDAARLLRGEAILVLVGTGSDPKVLEDALPDLRLLDSSTFRDWAQGLIVRVLVELGRLSEARELLSEFVSASPDEVGLREALENLDASISASNAHRSVAYLQIELNDQVMKGVQRSLERLQAQTQEWAALIGSDVPRRELEVIGARMSVALEELSRDERLLESLHWLPATELQEVLEIRAFEVQMDLASKLRSVAEALRKPLSSLDSAVRRALS